jgi:hypothetical protein
MSEQIKVVLSEEELPRPPALSRPLRVTLVAVQLGPSLLGPNSTLSSD